MERRTEKKNTAARSPRAISGNQNAERAPFMQALDGDRSQA